MYRQVVASDATGVLSPDFTLNGAPMGSILGPSRQRQIEVKVRGWDEIDVIFVTGDAYVDHPAFAPARAFAASSPAAGRCSSCTTTSAPWNARWRNSTPSCPRILATAVSVKGNFSPRTSSMTRQRFLQLVAEAIAKLAEPKKRGRSHLLVPTVQVTDRNGRQAVQQPMGADARRSSRSVAPSTRVFLSSAGAPPKTSCESRRRPVWECPTFSTRSPSA